MPTEDRHEGVQRKVWMPESLNTAVEKLAAAAGQPISATLRELITAGLHADAHTAMATEQIAEMVASALAPLVSRIDHLERLIFFTAQNAAYTAVVNERAGQAAAAKMFPNDPDRAAEWMQGVQGEIRGLVHERVRKALRGSNPVRNLREPAEDEEG